MLGKQFDLTVEMFKTAECYLALWAKLIVMFDGHVGLLSAHSIRMQPAGGAVAVYRLSIVPI